ncbi:MAG: hypothetical protein ABJB05_00165 [Parafilimonas sp.]
MKIILSVLLLATTFFSFAQDAALKKGNTVFVQQISANDNVKDYTNDFANELQDWGYWKITSSKDNADFIIDLNFDSHKGITLTSWGGESVMVSAKFHTKSGDKLFQTETYQASPNGSNGFNGGKSSIKKLIRGLKKHFN